MLSAFSILDFQKMKLVSHNVIFIARIYYVFPDLWVCRRNPLIYGDCSTVEIPLEHHPVHLVSVDVELAVQDDVG